MTQPYLYKGKMTGGWVVLISLLAIGLYRLSSVTQFYKGFKNLKPLLIDRNCEPIVWWVRVFWNCYGIENDDPKEDGIIWIPQKRLCDYRD